ncbi:DUF1819 family protein [Vampirovibrio sp.]|uniref:DUF1819 family protein n=1 Tax=Vampirovibrio sp. TaxID=2717857 RepID=UPI003593E459
MKIDSYSMSFTTGSLFRQESVQVAALFLEYQDWNKVRDRVLSENLLQFRTMNTLKRVCREIFSRLKTLSPDELTLLVHSTTQEKGHLLWLAICRRYKFIEDFAIEILRERYLTLKKELPYEEFDAFFSKKSDWHEKLNTIKPATKAKLRQTLFKMLREADLLTGNNIIQAAMLSPKLLRAVQQENKDSILIFPTMEPKLVGAGI